jgi:hypothetical protein
MIRATIIIALALRDRGAGHPSNDDERKIKNART